MKVVIFKEHIKQHWITSIGKKTWVIPQFGITHLE